MPPPWLSKSSLRVIAKVEANYRLVKPALEQDIIKKDALIDEMMARIRTTLWPMPAPTPKAKIEAQPKQEPLSPNVKGKKRKLEDMLPVVKTETMPDLSEPDMKPVIAPAVGPVPSNSTQAPEKKPKLEAVERTSKESSTSPKPFLGPPEGSTFPTAPVAISPLWFSSRMPVAGVELLNWDDPPEAMKQEALAELQDEWPDLISPHEPPELSSNNEVDLQSAKPLARLEEPLPDYNSDTDGPVAIRSPFTGNIWAGLGEEEMDVSYQADMEEWREFLRGVPEYLEGKPAEPRF